MPRAGATVSPEQLCGMFHRGCLRDLMSKLHLITYGCQMNEYDSERVAGLLKQERYELTRSPGGRRPDPPQHLRDPREGRGQGLLAARRAASISRRERPDLVIGVMGCMAQLQKGRIQERAPYVDLVFGSPAIARVGELVERARRGAAARCSRPARAPLVKITAKPDGGRAAQGLRHGDGGLREALHLLRRAAHARPRAQPSARGHRGARSAGSRPTGCREVTLLGQTVNAYGRDLDAAHRPGRAVRARQRRRRHRAHPLHDLEPLQPHAPADPRHPRRAEGVRVLPPAAAVGLGPRARADEPRLHARRATSS